MILPSLILSLSGGTGKPWERKIWRLKVLCPSERNVPLSLLSPRSQVCFCPGCQSDHSMIPIRSPLKICDGSPVALSVEFKFLIMVSGVPSSLSPNPPFLREDKQRSQVPFLGKSKKNHRLGFRSGFLSCLESHWVTLRSSTGLSMQNFLLLFLPLLGPPDCKHREDGYCVLLIARSLVQCLAPAKW